MVFSFLGLIIVGGFLLAQHVSLDSATESAALAAASQIDVSAYQQSGLLELNSTTVLIDEGTTGDPDPCGIATPDQTLCAVYQVLDSDYNPNGGSRVTITNAPVAPAAAATPPSLNQLKYWVSFQGDGSNQIAVVTTAYAYPNPLGDILVSQLQEQSTQYASPNLSLCNNGNANNTC
jgi:hypothetical protein